MREMSSSRRRISFVPLAGVLTASAAAGYLLLVGGAAPATSAARVDAGERAPSVVISGKAVWKKAGCGRCHILAAAGSRGKIGPNLDREKPSLQLVTRVVTKGTIAMPSFKGKLKKAEIAAVAKFVVASTRKK